MSPSRLAGDQPTQAPPEQGGDMQQGRLTSAITQLGQMGKTLADLSRSFPQATRAIRVVLRSLEEVRNTIVRDSGQSEPPAPSGMLG